MYFWEPNIQEFVWKQNIFTYLQTFNQTQIHVYRTKIRTNNNVFFKMIEKMVDLFCVH